MHPKKIVVASIQTNAVVPAALGLRFGVLDKSFPRGTNDPAAGLKGMTW